MDISFISSVVRTLPLWTPYNRTMSVDKIFKEKSFIASPLGATENSGVYAVCYVKFTNLYPVGLKKYRVVYIGSSYNIQKRVKNQKHPYRRVYSICKNYSICLFYFECDNYLEVEKLLIKKYQPRFNKQHK